MEEDKAAAYYDELTRKGSGAARFKQGLGFSSAATTTDHDPLPPPPPPRGSSSFMSTFVKASSSIKEPLNNEVDDRKTQILNIQNKLEMKDPTSERIRVEGKDGDRRRSRSRDRDSDLRYRSSRYRSPDRRRRSRSRSRRSRSQSGDRSRRTRSRSRSRDRSTRTRSRSRSRDRSRRSRSRTRRGRSRSRSRSARRVERGRESNGGGEKGRRSVRKEGNGAIDYASLIHGYDKMTPAERVKAKMKLQLSQTVEKDTKVGSGSQWERFDFNKDAPLDDKEIEATDDDASLVKHIGQSFRFKSLEAKRENQIENAHDEAMFGVPVRNPSYSSESGKDGGSESESENENVNDNKGFKDEAPTSSLINEKVLWKQQGSWRDRASKKVG